MITENFKRSPNTSFSLIVTKGMKIIYLQHNENSHLLDEKRIHMHYIHSTEISDLGTIGNRNKETKP